MPTKRTYTERIADIQKKQEQLKAIEKQLRAKQTKEERNKRTKRLIEVGAIVEKGIGLELDTQEKKDALLAALIAQRDGISLGDRLRDKITAAM